MLIKLLAPHTFYIVNRYVMLVCFLLSLFGLPYSFYLIFYESPLDYQQMDLVKIMYIHVPCAWLSLMFYALLGLCSFIYLVWRIPTAFIVGRAASEVGCVFCIIALVTGSLWGYPTWGTWWVWDARLTSMLILLMFYCGYAIIVRTNAGIKSARVASVISLIGVINIPIVKFSVNIWNTLHQTNSISITKSNLDPKMTSILLLCFATLLCVGASITAAKAQIILWSLRLGHGK